MIKRSYYWKDINEKKLKELDFRYSAAFSDGCKAYIKYVPIYHYSEVIVLEARIIAYLDGEVKVDVMDSAFHSYYAAWYVEEDYDRYPFLYQVDSRLQKKLNQYGIKERKIKDGSKVKKTK